MPEEMEVKHEIAYDNVDDLHVAHNALYELAAPIKLLLNKYEKDQMYHTAYIDEANAILAFIKSRDDALLEKVRELRTEQVLSVFRNAPPGALYVHMTTREEMEGIDEDPGDQQVSDLLIRVCTVCDGSGYIQGPGNPCPSCGGTGKRSSN